MSASRLPDFVIAGAQKSASTFIQDALNCHPDIYIPAEETRFFEDPEYDESKLEVLSCLFDGRSEKAVGIKRPDYFGRPEVPERIRAKIPAAKIIIVLRNPVDRLVSAYYFYIKLGFLPPVDINDAIPRLLDGKSIGNVKDAELLAYGKYATHLNRYRKVFPEDQIRIIFQEDIKTAPEREIASVCTFIGVDPGAIRTLPSSANTGVYPLQRLRFLSRRNRYLYDYDSVNGKLIPKRRKVSNLIPAAAITLTDRWFLSRVFGNSKPALDRQVRASLVTYYRDEVEGIAEMTGRDLHGWGIGS